MTDNRSADEGSEPDPATEPNSLVYTIDPDERPSEAIVRAVGTVTETAILDLDPLYDVVDPEHVNGVFERVDGDTGGAELSFEFNGCMVTVTHGEVAVVVLEESR